MKSIAGESSKDHFFGMKQHQLFCEIHTPLATYVYSHTELVCASWLVHRPFPLLIVFSVFPNPRLQANRSVAPACTKIIQIKTRSRESIVIGRVSNLLSKVIQIPYLSFEREFITVIAREIKFQGNVLPSWRTPNQKTIVPDHDFYFLRLHWIPVRFFS